MAGCPTHSRFLRMCECCEQLLFFKFSTESTDFLLTRKRGIFIL
jgi:hypothetical protein